MPFIPSLINKLKSKPPYCSVVIAAAGSSKRMGGEDKLFVNIGGKPALIHSLIAFQYIDLVKEIVIVANADKFEHISKLCARYKIDKATKIMKGGATRVESVMNGVLAVSKKARIIAIHDSARPCVDSSLIIRTISAASKYHAVAPGIPVSSTIKRVKDGIVSETVDRDGLFEIQTPQVFTAEIIKAALAKAIKKSVEITDDCMAAELIGVLVYITEGSRSNIKLTTSEDIAIAEALIRKRMFEEKNRNRPLIRNN
jgi:2-C-methyl-D-erythritol 4-phosphate cytidylyltransferase